MEEAFVAIDVGGTKSAVGIVTRQGRVVGRRVEPARVATGPMAMVDRYVAMARELMDTCDGVRLVGVGIGCGGPLDIGTGVIHSPTHLPGWDELPLKDWIEARLNLPTTVENDANAAALAEWLFGLGRNLRHLAYVTVSTGIGAGLILDGRLHRGRTGNAGEIGHTSVRPDGSMCGCGNHGCLELLASGTGIAHRAEELLAPSVRGTPPPAVRAQSVLERAKAGDRVAAQVWREAMAHLGVGIANLVSLLDPELVILGGGVTRAGEELLRIVRGEVAWRARWFFTPSLIVLSDLGDDVGLIGAAAAAEYARRDPR